jgi:pimeloyl-ACP methyl ester carboxylesterase
MSTTIGHVGRSDTETLARPPDEHGFVERDGIRVYWESYGNPALPAILLLPAWSIVHARQWKLAIPYLARRFRVLAYDPRGNGLSDRPRDPARYRFGEFVDDAVDVLDAASVSRSRSGTRRARPAR